MGKPTGFLDYDRETAKVLPPKVRIADFKEFRIPLIKKNKNFRGHAVWHAEFPSASRA